MGKEGLFRKKPDSVEKALRSNNREALLAMGASGGRESARRKKAKAEKAVMLVEATELRKSEKQKQEEYELRKSTNEDVAPVD